MVGRIVSWNVNGIRAILRKEIDTWQVVPGADVICLQEIKARPDQLPPAVADPEGWHALWAPAQRPGYSGVMLASRQAPDEVCIGLGDSRFDDEGRLAAMRFGTLLVIGAYFPNAQEAGRRLDYKLAFCDALLAWMQAWQARGCDTVLVGDYNIAHQPIDLTHPAANEGNPGYLPEERAWFSRYLAAGHRDIYREANPERTGAYTWWSYRAQARANNVGWRIDYATVNEALAGRVRATAIHPEVIGSDHCPVSVDLADG